MSWVGRPVPRLEDGRFLRGAARFLDDLPDDGAAHAIFVRSLFAHGRIVLVDADAARARPDVVALVTGDDLAGLGVRPLFPFEGAEIAEAAAHPPLARGRVRYVGDPVAVVVGESAEAARDAADEVLVELEPLPALVDPREALEATTLLHEQAQGNVLFRWLRKGGDVEGAFSRADRVVCGRFHVPRLVAAAIEPRGAMAAYDRGEDVLTLWISAQDPHRPLGELAAILQRPRERIRVVVPDVGGAFGSKGLLPPEAAVVAWLALRLGRPVKWIETRTENFLAAHQGRGLDAEVELAVSAAGDLLGIRARLVADAGAYLFAETVVPPVTAAMLLTGVYRIPAADVEVVGAATTKVPTGPYRGAGRPEAALLVERMVDLAAAELGLDPVEVRRRNLIPADAFPYSTPLGFTYDSGDYEQMLDRALRLLDVQRWRGEQARVRAEGRLVGIGVAFYVERAGALLWESAAVSRGENDRIIVFTGSSSHGQGHETVFAQIAADELGVDLADVEVVSGDTARVPPGVGTFASRSITVGGSALLLALRELRETDAPRTEARFQLPGLVFPAGVHCAVVEVDQETGSCSLLRLAAVDDVGRAVNPLLIEGQVHGACLQGIGQALVEHEEHDADGQPLALSLEDYHVPRALDVPPIASEIVEVRSPFNPLGAKGAGEGGAIGAPAAIANALADALAPLGISHLDFPFTPERVWRAISDRARAR